MQLYESLPKGYLLSYHFLILFNWMRVKMRYLDGKLLSVDPKVKCEPEKGLDIGQVEH